MASKKRGYGEGCGERKLTFAQLSEAAGKLTRAAGHLLRCSSLDDDACRAMGTLMGLAYVIRPQIVTVN